jgi:ABC-2 type transport system permease protein
VTSASTLVHQARVVRVLAATAFKLKYEDSLLGYFWSLARPLGLFLILYLVFGRALRLGDQYADYPLFLLLGVVLFFFFLDATMRAMTSIVDQSQLLRKVSFPRVIIPIAVSVTALVTLGLNLVAIAAFLAWNQVVPRVDWLLILPLIVELYAFTLGTSLLLAVLFAYFRDIGAIWELGTRAFFYAGAIIIPVQLLPGWAERAVLLVPFTQVMQDVRALILPDTDVVTTGDVLGGAIGYVGPIAITVAVLLLGLLFFRRQEPWFAERL